MRFIPVRPFVALLVHVALAALAPAAPAPAQPTEIPADVLSDKVRELV